MDALNTLTSTEWIIGLFVCILATGIGVFFAKKQARTFSGQGNADVTNMLPSEGDLPNVNYFDYGDMRFLHLGSPSVQGSMKISKPYEIHLEYVQRMMAWLLFADLDQLPHRHAMQLGLGAAALTKFCHHTLRMQTTAVELNSQVVKACRLWFKLPMDNDTLQVLVADAAEVASNPQWHQKIDALQVDLYDQDAARPAIDTEDFYRDCRRLLSDYGCMAVNLFGHDYSDSESYRKITAAFGADAVWTFKPTSAGNTIVLALRTPRSFDNLTLQSQAQSIEARWSLPAKKWLKNLTPPPTK